MVVRDIGLVERGSRGVTSRRELLLLANDPRTLIECCGIVLLGRRTLLVHVLDFNVLIGNQHSVTEQVIDQLHVRLLYNMDVTRDLTLCELKNIVLLLRVGGGYSLNLGPMVHCSL